MPDQNSTTATIWAALVGVDHYQPGRLPGGIHYPSLGGCVRDINHVESFLVDTLKVPRERILKLTATNTGRPGQPEPPEPREAWPTYENLVATFKRLAEMAQPGDRVYIHYSGHGGRAKTMVPQIKGADGIDEGLVPTDIHVPTAQYLRDVELGRIFQEMADKGLRLAVVLDCCHSGGAVRGDGDVAVRGLGVVDATSRPQESLVASPQELAESWNRLTDGGTRSVAVGGGWLPEPRGYVLLAACRPTESAYEYAFDGRERNGALTYWLLDTLLKHGPGLSAKALHERIVALVHSQFQQQTPQLQGEGQNPLFGGDGATTPQAATVLEVDAANERVRLISVGQAFGNRKGAQFAIYPFGTTIFDDAAKRQAIATIADVGATDSWAEITASLSDAPIEPGAPAILIDQGSLKLIRKVGLPRRDDLPAEIDQDRALEAVRAALAGNPWVAEATPDDTLEYQVAVNEAGEYEIWDPAGVPIANLQPPLRIDTPDAAASVLRRLVHLTQYHAVKQLDNHDQRSPLAGKLVVELARLPDDYQPGDQLDPRPFDEPGNTPVLRPDQWILLTIRNEAPVPLNIAVLDLQPDWGITQIFPAGFGAGFSQLEPGRAERLDLRASLPDHLEDGTDVLKVFASVGPANFGRLTLPSLDRPVTRSAAERESATRGEPNPLEDLMDAITGESPPALPTTRTFTPASYPSREWTTAYVEVHVRRAG